MPFALTTGAVLIALILGGCTRDVHPGDGDGGIDTDVDTDADTGPTDADGDGWTVAGGDCDDGDPEVHPERNEVCSDGIDNDCDGLVDCEDGDCAAASGCFENCYAPGDEDDDGLADCEDDDCWAEPYCRVASIRVTGGRAEGRAVSSDRFWVVSTSYWFGCGKSWDQVRDLRLWSVTGTARVRAPDTGGVRLCTWSAPYATVHVEFHYNSHIDSFPRIDPGSFVPVSFRGQSGCSFGSGFLPQALDVVPGRGAWHVISSVSWYHDGWWIAGSASASNRSAVLLKDTSGVFRSSNEIVTRSWQIPSLDMGVPYSPWRW